MSKTSDLENKELPTQRWWEAYLVRYFVGTIVGAICSAMIILKLSLANDSVIKEVASKVLGDGAKFDLTPMVLGGLLIGFCYCYLCSAPITVMHVGRYGRGKIDGKSRYFWGAWVVSIFLLLCRTFSEDLVFYENYSLWWCLLMPLCVILFWKQSSKKIHFIAISIFWGMLIHVLLNQIVPEKDSEQFIWIELSLPVVWIGLIQYDTLLRTLFECDDLFKFYKKLFKSRRESGAKDVRDTYTHLREHSNAFFIVVVEICTLAFICASEKLTPKYWGSAILLSLMVWLIPTIYMWARANAMEKDFAENSKDYLGEQ